MSDPVDPPVDPGHMQFPMADTSSRPTSRDREYHLNQYAGLTLGRTLGRAVADNLDKKENIIITAYEPNPAVWEIDFKRRKTT